MKYNINVGSHAAQVELNEDGKGSFTGTVTHTEYGDGAISGKVNGNSFTGTVNLDGHDADFKASTNGLAISGTITPTGFLSMLVGPSSFTGTKAA